MPLTSVGSLHLIILLDVDKPYDFNSDDIKLAWAIIAYILGKIFVKALSKVSETIKSEEVKVTLK